MASFPAYIPTSRSFTPGTYPQKAYRSMAGIVTKRTFGNRPSQAKLDLEFQNVNDTTAAAIISHYRAQTAANRRFNVTATTMAGLDISLLVLANGSSDTLRWEYANPPEVQSVRPGKSSITVSLIGEIRDPATDDL
jgi:hypothetical protein